MACSSDGKFVAAGSPVHGFTVWDTSTWERMRDLKFLVEVTSVISSPDGRFLVATGPNEVRTWDWLSGVCAGAFALADPGARYITLFSPDDRLLVVAVTETEARIWSISANELQDDIDDDRFTLLSEFPVDSRHVLLNARFDPYVVALSLDGERLAVLAYRMYAAWICDTTRQTWRKISRFGLAVTSLSFYGNNQMLITGDLHGIISIWDGITTDTDTARKCIKTLQGHKGSGSITSLIPSPARQQLISSSSDGKVKIWDVSGLFPQQGDNSADAKGLKRTGVPAREEFKNRASPRHHDNNTHSRSLEGHTDFVMSLGFSPDGRVLVSSSENGEVKVWDLGNDKCLVTCEGRPVEEFDDYVEPASWASITPNSGRVALLLRNLSIGVWDLGTSERTHTLANQAHEVQSLAISPDGEYLAVASDRIDTWSISQEACVHTVDILGGRHIMRAPILSPDLRLVAVKSGSTDSVEVWDRLSVKCIRTLLCDNGREMPLAFSVNNQWLVTKAHRYSGLRFRSRRANSDDNTLGQEKPKGQIISVQERGESAIRVSTRFGDLIRRDVDDSSDDTATFSDYGISANRSWIMKGEQRLLWIPLEHRVLSLHSQSLTVAIGCDGGIIALMELADPDEG